MSFTRRDLSSAVEGVREAHAPDALVLDVGADFETLDPALVEELGLLVEGLSPATYSPDWIPGDAPELLDRYVSDRPAVGLPGDGSVAWTRQTDPPVVLVKPRVEGSPDGFVDFLVAEALVAVGLELPETFVPFFGERYPDLDRAVDLDPNATFQVAAALYDAWVGLHTREVFADWDPDGPLGTAWRDAGERLAGRIDGLHAEIAGGRTDFAAATELACSGVKHGLDLPAPFSALATKAYRERGAPFAVAWAEKTFAELPD